MTRHMKRLNVGWFLLLYIIVWYNRVREMTMIKADGIAWKGILGSLGDATKLLIGKGCLGQN